MKQMTPDIKKEEDTRTEGYKSEDYFSDGTSTADIEDALITIDIPTEKTSLLGKRKIATNPTVTNVAKILRALIANKTIDPLFSKRYFFSFQVNFFPADKLLALLSYLAKQNYFDITFEKSEDEDMIEIQVGADSISKKKRTPQMWTCMLITLQQKKNNEVKRFLDEYQSAECTYKLVSEALQFLSGSNYDLQNELKKRTEVSIFQNEYRSYSNEQWAVALAILNKLPTAQAKQIEFKIDSGKRLCIAFKDFTQDFKNQKKMAWETNPELLVTLDIKAICKALEEELKKIPMENIIEEHDIYRTSCDPCFSLTCSLQ